MAVVVAVVAVAVDGISGEKEDDDTLDVAIAGVVVVLAMTEGSLMDCAALLNGLRGDAEEEISAIDRLCVANRSPREEMEEEVEEEVEEVNELVKGLNWLELYFSGREEAWPKVIPSPGWSCCCCCCCCCC